MSQKKDSVNITPFVTTTQPSAAAAASARVSSDGAGGMKGVAGGVPAAGAAGTVWTPASHRVAQTSSKPKPKDKLD